MAGNVRKFGKGMKPLIDVSRETLDQIEEAREARRGKKAIETARKKLLGQGFIMDKFIGNIRRRLSR